MYELNKAVAIRINIKNKMIKMQLLFVGNRDTDKVIDSDELEKNIKLFITPDTTRDNKGVRW